MKRIFPKGYNFSPSFIFRGFGRMLVNVDPNIVMKHTAFQKEREAWITAMFLAGINKTDNKEYYIEIEEDEQTPDTYGIHYNKMEKGYEQQKMCFEICEWEKHSKLPLADHIIKKLDNKVYPPHFILLCYIHGHSGEAVNMETVYEEINSHEIGVSEIFVLGSVVDPDVDNIILKMFPNKFQITMNLPDEVRRLASINQRDIMNPHRGVGHEFEPLGEVEIKWPQVK